nr:hypothetical protein [Tanacetum cinerariifolium]
MVDLLGRASCLDELSNFVNSMPVGPHYVVWGALLSASRTHCRLGLAEIAARHISELEHDNATPFVVLSDIYLFSKKKDDEELVRTMKRLKGTKKTCGCSWITIKDDVNLFLSGNQDLMKDDELAKEIKEGLDQQKGEQTNGKDLKLSALKSSIKHNLYSSSCDLHHLVLLVTLDLHAHTFLFECIRVAEVLICKVGWSNLQIRED